MGVDINIKWNREHCDNASYHQLCVSLWVCKMGNYKVGGEGRKHICEGRCWLTSFYVQLLAGVRLPFLQSIAVSQIAEQYWIKQLLRSL